MINKSAIVSVIHKITQINKNSPCKKALQKLIFLIEAKNVDIGCDYGIHFYGPYSADLDFAIQELSNDGILKIEYTPMEHFVSVVDQNMGNNYNDKIMDEIIKEFGNDTASELELIATALYIYLQIKDINGVKAGVNKIKGNKYTEKRISDAIERLKRTGYITA